MVLVVKNSPPNAGDIKGMGLVPGSGRVSGIENGNQLRYSCLKSSTEEPVGLPPWGHREFDTLEHTSVHWLDLMFRA